MLILYFALAAAVLWAAGAVSHMVRCHAKHCRCPLPQRYFSGRSLNGHRIWDSTFWHEGTRTLPGVVEADASRFQRLPGWERRTWRTVPLAAAAACLLSLARSQDQQAWLALAAACVAVLLAVGVLRFLRQTKNGRRILGRMRRHSSGRVDPMSQKLATITGTAPRSLKGGIKWAPDYANTKPGEVVARWTDWPHDFKATGKERAQVQDLWTARLGFALVFQWKTDIDQPELVMTRAYELPAIVYLHEYLDQLTALPADKIGLGIDDRGRLVCWDWRVENPHGLTVGGSRHGKTELNRSKVAQVARKGGHVLGIDCKRISFQGLEGIPGFTLRNNPRDIRGMWESIRGFYEEMDRRAEERGKDPTAEFPRWLLIIEEVLQFSEMTDEWWDELEIEDPRDAGTLFFKTKRAKKTPRVWRWIKSICWEGAEFGMHVDIDGQDGVSQYLKGVKSVLGLRVLGGFQPNQWDNCVGTTPRPAAPKTKGRFCLVSGVEQTWFQAFVGHLDKTESAAIWRDYARAGRRMDGTPGAAYQVDAAGQVSAVSDIGAELSVQRSDLHGYPHVPESLGHALTGPASLEELVSSGVIRTTLTAAQRRSTRDPDHPQPVGRRGNAHLYDIGQMRAYELLKSRVRAR